MALPMPCARSCWQVRPPAPAMWMASARTSSSPSQTRTAKPARRCWTRCWCGRTRPASRLLLRSRRVTDSSAAMGRLLPADRFHAGVRVATLVLWLAAIVAAYVVLGLIANQIFGSLPGLGVLLLFLAAVVVAQPMAWLGERQLLARWPSGRAVQLEPGALVWRDRPATCRLDLSQKVNYWRWRFAVRRRRSGRVPGNHH